MKTENNNKTRTSDQKRVFQILAGYELERLAKDLAEWNFAHQCNPPGCRDIFSPEKSC